MKQLLILSLLSIFISCKTKIQEQQEFGFDIMESIEMEEIEKKYYKPLKAYMAQQGLGKLQHGGTILSSETHNYIGGYSFELYLPAPEQSIPKIKEELVRLGASQEIKIYRSQITSIHIADDESKEFERIYRHTTN